MKRAWYIIVFCLSLLLVLVMLDALYTFGLRHNQNLKLTNTASSPPDAAILFHGPCEPLWMISPTLLDKQTGRRSFNLALSHSDFADNYLHLYMYLKHNKAPQYLFLFVTPESFDKRYNTFNTFRFAAHMDDPVVNRVVAENDPGYARWSFIPFMRYAYYNRRLTFYMIQGLKHYFTDRKEAYYPDGFEPPAKRLWGNHAGDFAHLYEKNIRFKTDSLRLKYLVETIRLAKGKGIRVKLYESPVLYESLAQQANRKEMLAQIQTIAKSEQVQYIQFDSLEMAKQRKYYISTLSLNMEGVELFNDTLARYIRVYCGQ